MVGIFRAAMPITRLIGVVVAEQNDEWDRIPSLWDWKSGVLAERQLSPGWAEQDITSEAGLTIEAILAYSRQITRRSFIHRSSAQPQRS